MKVVFASHTYLSPVFVVGSQHLARAAARAAHDVWHLSSAISVPHLPFTLLSRDYRARARLAWSAGRSVEPHLWESVPFTLAPWSLVRWAERPEVEYLRGFRSVRRVAERLGFQKPDLLLIDEPRLASVVDALNAKVVIYRPTDLYSQLKHDDSLSQVEERLLERVHGVVATSAPVLDHVRSMRADLPALLLENGVDCDHFTTPQKEPPDLFGIPRPRAIYVGAVDERFDDRLLHAAAAENPDISFIVIGGQTRQHAVGANSNVFYLGQRRYADVPGYVQSSDLAVMPLTSTAANQGRSPMKVFEFGAAGLPVVATATAELRRRNLPFVSLAESDSDFKRSCAELAHSNTDRLRAQARRSAASHGWHSKAERLFAFAETLIRERAPRPTLAQCESG